MLRIVHKRLRRIVAPYIRNEDGVTAIEYGLIAPALRWPS